MSQRTACLIKPCFAYLPFLSLGKLSRAGRGWRDTCGQARAPVIPPPPAPSPSAQIVWGTSAWPQKYFAKDKGVQSLPCPMAIAGQHLFFPAGNTQFQGLMEKTTRATGIASSLFLRASNEKRDAEKAEKQPWQQSFWV